MSGEIQAAFPSSIVSGNRRNFRDQIQARAALLADGSYVLLPTDADARILALRFDELPAVRVEQTSASAIGHGDYLALRNRPHHEDLMGRADALLGADAESLRTTQSAWKELLWERTKAHPRGIRGISDVIRQRGASTANVGYWISDWCIRPRSKTDFAIVLRFLDFATDLDTTWKRLGRIDSAHRRAGQRYVDDIQRAATPDRMNRLMDIGWCAVTPAGVDSETLLVRVEHILPELLFVPVSALCRLRATEGCK
ncbi:hypothetical protein GCM10022419_112710 [Nonomuraea rosea]|uniref:Uncharacterized protein n=1 Tax=Nonomuraea rosea TaxID=638574 RepID=A0ABP6ZGP4_9ACTN